MNPTMQFILNTATIITLAVSGYFASAQATSADKVEKVQTAQAATDQKLSDVDTRLTRIEDKLDQVLLTVPRTKIK